MIFIFLCLFFVDSVPVPTESQLQYQLHEISALIHFNMATFAGDGDPGCRASNWDVVDPSVGAKVNNPATFNPTKLDVNNWVESFKALGVKHAVLTAKHGCGHLLWPTNVTLPDGREYLYGVGHSKSAIKYDILKEFSEVMEKNGIGHGFYYSLTNNFYLRVEGHKANATGAYLPGQENVTQAEFEKIALGHVTELWSKYGKLFEIWFDGGYTSDMKAKITELLNNLQPKAATWGGECVGASPICWVGTESGHPKTADIWTSGLDGPGDPNSTIICPKGVDTTLQTGDRWFYVGNPIRSLEELITVYHDSVGKNGVLEMDFAINKDGLVAPDHAVRYKELGDWIRNCYSTPITKWTSGKGKTTMSLNVNTTIDRVMIQEDLAFGQRVREFNLTYTNGDGNWLPFASGHSIGNKRISINNITLNTGIKTIRLEITKFADKPLISTFAAFAPCPWT